MTRFWRYVVSLAAVLVSTAAAANTIVYYHNDIAGSPVAATDASGQVLWRESYRPYGERITNSAASVGNDVWFTSRRQDVETGLVYMGARYYDPVIGRFISTDPVGFDEANVHTFNRYAYAANNPYKFVDRDGRKFEFATGSSDAFKADIAAMRQYLSSGGVGQILSELDQRPETILLQQGAPAVSEYVPHYRTITIDTRSGNDVGTGIQSPALGFLHEAAHALQHLSNKRQFESDTKRGSDSQYDTKEERRVIEKVETPAAKMLGESTRSDHVLRHVPVACPTCRK